MPGRVKHMARPKYVLKEVVLPGGKKPEKGK